MDYLLYYTPLYFIVKYNTGTEKPYEINVWFLKRHRERNTLEKKTPD